MPLDGLHHITAITADAPANVDFYARVLGLRLIKKTVNFDAPDVYHLYFADEAATPGAVLTFFEFPGTPRGRAGAGMVYRIEWRVADEAALEFWSQRLGNASVGSEHAAGALRFADPEGLEHELRVVETPDAPLVARAPDVPAEHALRGFEGVRAYAADPQASNELLGVLGFSTAADAAGASAGWELGDQRHASLRYDAPPAQPGLQGAGSVHHIAFNARDDDALARWRLSVTGAGARPTPVIDRQYFHSVYFREPSGVLFELATAGPGFTIDEPLEKLGESLCLPPQYEPLRERLEQSLTPLVNPRSAAAAGQ